VAAPGPGIDVARLDAALDAAFEPRGWNGLPHTRALLVESRHANRMRAAMISTLTSATPWPWPVHVSGTVQCDQNSNGVIDISADLPIPRVAVRAPSLDLMSGQFTAVTDSSGGYDIVLPTQSDHYLVAPVIFRGPDRSRPSSGSDSHPRRAAACPRRLRPLRGRARGREHRSQPIPLNRPDSEEPGAPMVHAPLQRAPRR
jgi:hypothetical protein